MPEAYPEQWLGSGIRYTGICDPKFRSCLLSVQFYVHRDAESAPVHALLPDLLTASSAAFPSVAEMTLQLELLYAADFLAKLSLCGDDAVLDFTASWLDDRFALEGEALTDEMLSLVIGALLRPHAENGAFCDPEFRICKQNLLDDIDCEQNDKRGYVLRRTAELAYQGAPAAIPPHGSRAAAEAVTPEAAYRLWQEILRSASIEIVAVTPAPKPQIAARFAEAFRTLRREPLQFCFDAPCPPKQAPVLLEEQMPVGQTKLAAAFQYDEIPREVMLMLCSILGWNADALLFTNLREKKSLCYYCCLQHSGSKHTIFIDCGIDAADLEAVRQEIHAQIKALQNGDFTDEMMETSVLRHACRAAAASDSPYDTAAELLARRRCGDPCTPQEMTEALRQVTREQIMAAAKQLRPDAVFILRAEREEAEHDAD